MRQILIIASNTVKALIRKKDFYVFFLLLLVLLLFLMSQNFFGIKDISRYLKDVGLNLVTLFSVIIAITFSASQIPEELREKTALPLLAKPVARKHLVLGRFLGSLSASVFSYSVFFFSFALAAFLKGEGIGVSLLFQTYVLGICLLSIICSVTIFLSLAMTQSAAVTGSLVLYFFILWFSDIIRSAVLQAKIFLALPAGIVYYLVPHYEFFDMRMRVVHSWGGLSLGFFSSLIVYACLYTAVILVLTNRKFKNRII